MASSVENIRALPKEVDEFVHPRDWASIFDCSAVQLPIIDSEAKRFVSPCSEKDRCNPLQLCVVNDVH